MKLNKLTYILSAAALMLSVSSCKDFLDTMPDTRVELNSVEKARMLLVSSYPSYSPQIVCELTSDNMEDNNTADANGTRYNLASYSRVDDEIFAFQDVKSGSDADSPSSIWEGYYGAIAGANAVLECLDKLQARIDNGEVVEDANKIPALRGEALMLRAFSHFQLANVFCQAYRGPELSKSLQGLPYPTSPETTVKPQYDRMNLAEFYDKIEKDLTEALPLIDNSLYEVPQYHFNRQAAYSFAARFYLYKRDYQKVLDYCNLAFGGAGVDPSQYMSDIWAHLDEMYYISDFGLYYMDVTQPRNFMLIATYSQAWRHYISSMRYGCTRDAKRATIQGPGPSWSGFRWVSTASGSKETFSMHPCFNGSCGVNGLSQHGSYFAGNACEQFEYTNKIAGIGYTHVTRAEFTGEETLLMRAEAKLFLGDLNGYIDDLKVWDNARRNTPAAVGEEDKFFDLTPALIKKFYSESDPGYGIVKPINIDELTPSDTYKVTADIEPYLQCIQHLRRVETVHTGMRFFDLKRYGIEWSHKIGVEGRVETMSLYDPRRAIQIPSEVLSAGFEANFRAVDPESQNIQFYAPAQ